MLKKSNTATAQEDARQAYYDRIAPHDLAPLWVEIKKLLAHVPQPKAVPKIWHFNEIRPLLIESGELITAEEAERRVLILENPALTGQACATDTLYAGWQLILPGEIAPAHRHTQSALRFILEGSRAYTAVNGERAYMEEGDLILTPSWTWHDHGSESAKPMVWLDGLDIPIIRFLTTTFAEGYPDPVFPETRPPGDAQARYGTNMLPVREDRRTLASPVFRYPYTESREALERMRQADDIDPHEGFKLEYINPTTGGPAMPTISSFLQLVPKGFRTAPYRSTDGAVFSVAEGSGKIWIGEKEFSWSKRDAFVVPSWMEYQIEPNEDAVLFSFSDRVTQQSLGLWREQRGTS